MKKYRALSFVLFYILCFSLLLSPILSRGATFTVNTTADGPGIPGSLRFAINSANANGIPDTIIFNIPGAGVQTIYPLTQLPPLTDPAGVFIDGLTQPGANAGANPPSTAKLLIELNGAKVDSTHGLHILSSGNTIQGFVIDSFGLDGIRIEVTPDGTVHNIIYCNFVGTDTSGTVDCGNGIKKKGPSAGIHILVPPGGVGLVADNWILNNLSSGNYENGVAISSCPPEGDNNGNIVRFNYLGTDITGMNDLGNDHTGVCISEGAHDNLVDSNVISGNGTEGICIMGWHDGIPTFGNIITNNTIGLTVNHSSSLPNDREGISLGKYYGDGPGLDDWKEGYANNNVIGPNNTIAFNGKSGVMVWEHINSNTNADNNLITQNSIYNNGPGAPGYLGIDLSDDMVTANDGGDPDVGPNQELNFPVIDSAVSSAGNTTVYGSIDIDTDPTQATVEIFKANPDPTGYGEGATYLGSATPNGSGNWNTTVSGLNPGDTITATTTDVNRNTSEFCLNYILPYIIVTSPNGGENVLVGSTQDITWSSNGTSGTVHIEFSDNNGSTWHDVIASTTDDGSHTHTIPDMPSDSCLIRISDTDGSPSDVSDAVFTISTAPYITVTSPNGGEDWKVDSIYNVTWTSNGTSGNVKIEYSTDNGSVWSDVIASTTDNGTYSWTIPNTPSDSCLVKVSDTDGSPSDTSDALFTISLSLGVPLEGIPDVYSMNAKRITANKNLELSYTIPEAAKVRFSVYDITGKIIKELSKEEKPGFYSEKIDMSDVPAGVYFIKMEASGKEFTATDKVILIR
jgi:hypothetical protein